MEKLWMENVEPRQWTAAIKARPGVYRCHREPHDLQRVTRRDLSRGQTSSNHQQRPGIRASRTKRTTLEILLLSPCSFFFKRHLIPFKVQFMLQPLYRAFGPPFFHSLYFLITRFFVSRFRPSRLLTASLSLSFHSSFSRGHGCRSYTNYATKVTSAVASCNAASYTQGCAKCLYLCFHTWLKTRYNHAV